MKQTQTRTSNSAPAKTYANREPKLTVKQRRFVGRKTKREKFSCSGKACGLRPECPVAGRRDHCRHYGGTVSPTDHGRPDRHRNEDCDLCEPRDVRTNLLRPSQFLNRELVASRRTLLGGSMSRFIA